MLSKLLLATALSFSTLSPIIGWAQTATPINEMLPASNGKAGSALVDEALSVLVPAAYKVTIKNSVPADTAIKWLASPNWMAVLNDAIEQAQLKVTINKEAKTVIVYKEMKGKQVMTGGDALTTVISTADKKTNPWKIEVKDLTLANTFSKWANTAGWQVRWDADKHILVEAPDALPGTFEDAIAAVLSSPGVMSGYPLEVCFYQNSPPLARITRRGEQECK